MAEIWGVWCRVSGGVTGNREAWLKKEGRVAEFATEEEARAEAKRCRDGISKYATADFRYTAMPMDGRW